MNQKNSHFTVPWDKIKTILLDMDGTLLDLNYDNYVWNHALPAAYAKEHSMNLESARSSLITHMQEIHGTIDFYSFSYWTDYTKLDIVELHRRYIDLIEFRAGAKAFLAWAKRSNKTTIIATNAHPDSIKIKDEVSNISNLVDHVVSSHQYSYPKETSGFWQNLKEDYDIDKKRSIFIDDNAPVLDSSKKFGIAYNLIVSRPDSQKPKKTGLSYPAFDEYGDICEYLNESISD